MANGRAAPGREEQPMSTKQKTSTKTNARKRSRRSARTAPPWIESGIDYGPALVAIEELIAWAFDLAAASVADRESKRRVKDARRYTLASVRGRRTPPGAEADVMFTASLLIRILDADLGLGLGDIVEVLAALGLPTADVPHPPRRPAGVAARAPQRAQPTAAELAGVIDALQRGAARAPIVSLRRPSARAVVAPCAGCYRTRPGVAVAA
jgi:hypothetical protein